MTENNKRFTLKEISREWHDIILDNGIELPQSTACDLLNELHEENSKLHIENDFLQNEHQHFKEILKENNKLKQFIQKISNNNDEIVLITGYGYKIPKEAKK